MVVRQPLLSSRAIEIQESRASVAITVGWMLTLIVTGGALGLALVFYWLALGEELAPQSAKLLSLLGGAMMLSSALTGMACLVLTAAVHRVRRDRPPLAITAAAVFVSCLPLATMLLLALRA